MKTKKSEFAFQKLIVILLSLILLMFALWFIKTRVDTGNFALSYFFELFK